MSSNEQDFEFRLGTPSYPKLPLLAVSDRQDIYSMSLVQATIASAGYNYKKDRLDRRKTDLEISLPDVVDDPFDVRLEPRYSCLRIQVKCTYTCAVRSDGTIHYKLDADTYKFLIDKRSDPRILVLVHVPEPKDGETHGWITVNTDHTIVRNRLYWLSLMGGPPLPGKKSVTVPIPLANIFDARAVETLMNRIAVKGDKNYAG